MSKEKEIEKIINDKLNSREFAFDEKAWADMETLLDAQQKKRRFGFWWGFSASILLVLIAGAAWFFMPAITQNENKTELATSANQSATAEIGMATTPNGIAATEIGTATIPTEMAAAETRVATIPTGMATAEIGMATIPTEMAAAAIGMATIPTKMATAEIGTATVPTGMAAAEIEVATTPIEVKMVESQQDSTKTTEQALLTDSASLAETAKNPLTAPGKETKNVWGVMAGTGFWYQYQQTPGATNHKGGFPFTGGIYYQRSLSKRFDLGLSILYSSRGALNFDNTITNSNYGFGIESDITTISPQTLHYLNVPLHIRFNISHRSHIIIGATYYQLLATTSKATHTIESSFASTLTSSEKQTGEHKGFRKNDAAAFIGYELTLFDRMNTGLQFSYSFYDNTVNGYNGSFNGADSFDRNISLQLQLKYDLIRH
jgi:cytoskeletal protein RodZ